MTGCGTVFDLAIAETGNMYAVNGASQLHTVSYLSLTGGALDGGDAGAVGADTAEAEGEVVAADRVVLQTHR